MAWFNAPVLQEDHTLRACRAAVGIRKAMNRLQNDIRRDLQLSFGVGVHCRRGGSGAGGTEKRLEYTAIGDSVNTTKRIQENSKAGQILDQQGSVSTGGPACAGAQYCAITAKGKREP